MDELSALLLYLGETKFKVQAYERAAEVVGTVGPELAALVEQNRLRELSGIGSALSAQIQELYNTGSSALLERLRRQAPEGAAELVRVPGLTPRRIQALAGVLGIHSVAELRQACLDQRVRGVPGFGPKTEQQLLASAERWLARSPSQAPEPLLLSRALALLESLQALLDRASLRSAPAGAARRGEETLTRLSLLVEGAAEPVFEQLRKERQVLRIDAPNRTAYLSDRKTLQVHLAEPGSWGRAWFYATGDEGHVAAVEQRAAGRGVELGRASFASEAELYEAVGLPFVPAELRSAALDLDEVARDGVGELLEPSRILGLVHCHTTFSDGKHSVLEMAQAAHALGMKYITITDHSPSAHYARGASVEALQRQWDEIAEAEQRVPIRVLRGVESDILRDGDLDYPDAILDQLDVIIASIHARHRLGRDEMTARIQRALALPWFKIWGHGLGRILNHRPPIDCDVPAILDTLAASRGAVELNADPHRLDLPPAWIPAARARGIPFVVSVDAHSVHGFDVLRYGVTMARRGGVRSSEVLNTLSADEFLARVRPRAPA